MKSDETIGMGPTFCLNDLDESLDGSNGFEMWFTLKIYYWIMFVGFQMSFKGQKLIFEFAVSSATTIKAKSAVIAGCTIEACMTSIAASL